MKNSQQNVIPWFCFSSWQTNVSGSMRFSCAGMLRVHVLFLEVLSLRPCPMLSPETAAWILLGSLEHSWWLPLELRALCHLTDPAGGDGPRAQGDPGTGPSFGQFSLTFGLCLMLCLVWLGSLPSAGMVPPHLGPGAPAQILQQRKSPLENRSPESRLWFCRVLWHQCSQGPWTQPTVTNADGSKIVCKRQKFIEFKNHTGFRGKNLSHYWRT